ncbi:MAG: DF family (seleno)protein [Candidatus Ranarchaeia archaeon]
MINIDFLFFSGCPGWALAWSRLVDVIKELGIHKKVHIRRVEVTMNDEIVLYRFYGSPTIKINGQDIDRPKNPKQYGLACRIYYGKDGAESSPSKEKIRKALLSHLNR